MANLWKGLVKPIRTTLAIEMFLTIYNLFTNFIFLFILAIFMSFNVDFWSISIVDFIDMGIIAIALYIPWLIVMSVVKGFVLEMISPILTRWR